MTFQLERRGRTRQLNAMPRRKKAEIDPIVKLQNDLAKATLKRDKVLNIWNNNINLLLHHKNEYLLWKHSENKEGHSAYRKLSRLNNKINQINQELSLYYNAPDSESSNSEFSIHSNIMQKCSNCNRRACINCPERHEQTAQSDEIKTKREFTFARCIRSTNPIEC